MTRTRKLLGLNVGALAASLVLWVAAAVFGWLESVTFVSHVSMAALVLAAVSGIAAGDAAVESEGGSSPSWPEMPPAPTIEMSAGPDIIGAVPVAPVPPVAVEDDERGWRMPGYL